MDENPYQSPHEDGGGVPKEVVREPSLPADVMAWFMAIGGLIILAYIAYRIVVRNFGPYGYLDLIRELLWGIAISSAGLVVAGFGRRKPRHFAANAGMLLMFSGGIIYLLFFR